MPPPVLSYSTPATPTRWATRAAAGGMLCLGIWVAGRGLYTVCRPSTAPTAADQKVVVHNAWSAVVVGGVLMVPAGFVAVGLVRDGGPEQPRPGT